MESSDEDLCAIMMEVRENSKEKLKVMKATTADAFDGTNGQGNYKGNNWDPDYKLKWKCQNPDLASTASIAPDCGKNTKAMVSTRSGRGRNRHKHVATRMALAETVQGEIFLTGEQTLAFAIKAANKDAIIKSQIATNASLVTKVTTHETIIETWKSRVAEFEETWKSRVTEFDARLNRCSCKCDGNGDGECDS